MYEALNSIVKLDLLHVYGASTGQAQLSVVFLIYS